MSPINLPPEALPGESRLGERKAKGGRISVAAAKPEIKPIVHLMTRIIATINELCIVMEEEIPLIETRKRVEHAELLKRKQRLTLDYRSSLKAIVLEPTMLQDVPDELRVEARVAADRLSEVSTRNARVIRAVMTAGQRLVQTIVSIIKDEVLPKTGYTNAQLGAAGGSYSPICKPVTVSKTA